jgi:DNA-binding beta-propeller fold protein YncE
LFGSIGYNHSLVSAVRGVLGEHYVFATKWGSLGTANGQFRDAGGIGADALGHLYVVDRGNSRIEKFDSNGKFITAWGSLGTRNDQFNKATDVTVGSAGKVYVSDYGNNNVQVFRLR